MEIKEIKKLQEEAKKSLDRTDWTKKNKYIYDAFEFWSDIYFTFLCLCKERNCAIDISIDLFNCLIKSQGKQNMLVKGILNKYKFPQKYTNIEEILKLYEYYLLQNIKVDLKKENKRIKEFLMEG